MKTTGSPQELASLYKRMAEAMAQLKRLPKRGQNKHFNYMYVTDSDVLDAVRGALGGVGIAFFNDLVDMEQDGNRTLITLDATFADGETGASVTVTWAGEALDSQDKGINKALTGAIKYGLLKTLLVSTGEDDPDGEQPDDKGNGQKSKPAAKQAAKPQQKKPAPKQPSAASTAPAPEQAPADQWDALTPPADFTELWGGHRFAELGYESMQHAKNAIAKVYPGEKLGTGDDEIHVDRAWQALVDYAKSKEATNA